MIPASDSETPRSGKRPSWAELTRRCQKPDHRRVGNWMARCVVRPAAQAITWLLAPWPVPPDLVTLLAWGVLLAAGVALGQGTPAWLLAGAGLLQVWYLLDHVDGQLARLQRRETLQGTLLDYLMHHSFWFFVPLGLGWGVFQATEHSAWLLAGVAWAWGGWLLHAVHDARYKAFFKRLKRTCGPVQLRRQTPSPQPPGRWPAAWAARLRYLGRKATETHVVMNLLGLLAIGCWWWDSRQLYPAQLYLGAMSLWASAAACGLLWRELRLRRTEAEFARWFEPAPGHRWHYEPGRWLVVPREPSAEETASPQEPAPGKPFAEEEHPPALSPR